MVLEDNVEIKINRFIFNREDQTIICKIRYDGMMAHDEWWEEKWNRQRRETESAVSIRSWKTSLWMWGVAAAAAASRFSRVWLCATP